MSHALASLFFYTRFFHSFSRLGVWRCQRGDPAPAEAFSGQRWLVTGATGGIGRAIALGAATRGAQVLALGRDRQRLDALVAAAPAGRIQALRCDLSSIADGCKAVQSLSAPVDVWVNNIGVMLHDFSRTAEGVETSFATNVLVPFAMTERALERGLISPDGLLLAMSSGGLYGACAELAALEAAEADAHDGFIAYAQHKRAQALLCEHWNQRPRSPAAHVMHPGWVDTEGVRSALPGFRRVLGRLLRSAKEGADIALWLAAQRPPAQAAIWHDRAAHSLHAFSLTRGGVGAEQLVSHLRQRVDQALGS